MRNKIITTAAAVAALTSVGASHAAIELGEGLSVTGFMDMSWTHVDPDGAASEQSLGLDQFEMDFVYDFGDGLTAQVDLEYQDNGTGEEVDVEQAVISYAVSDEFAVKAGRFLSRSGFETEEPTGLFQATGTGYAKYFYGGYQQGVSAQYYTKTYDVAISMVNDLGDLEGEARDSTQPGFEAMLAIHPGDAWTLKAFYLTDKNESVDETATSINIWTAYKIGSLTLGLEANASEYMGAAVGIGGKDASGGLATANYAWDKWALTLRLHESEVEDAMGTVVEDLSGITISPVYKVSDNLKIFTEARFDSDNLSDTDSSTYTVQALLTF